MDVRESTLRKAPVRIVFTFQVFSLKLSTNCYGYGSIGCAGAASRGGPGGPVRPVRPPGPSAALDGKIVFQCFWSNPKTRVFECFWVGLCILILDDGKGKYNVFQCFWYQTPKHVFLLIFECFYEILYFCHLGSRLSVSAIWIREPHRYVLYLLYRAVPQIRRYVRANFY